MASAELENAATGQTVAGARRQYLHVEDADAKAGQAPSFKPFAVHTQPLIFPRYHQWHAAKSLIADAREKGAGAEKRVVVSHRGRVVGE